MHYSELTEVVFVSHPYRWTQREARRWEASFEVGKRQIEIIFTRLDGDGRQGGWRVDFRRGNYLEMRGTARESSGIIGTVAAAVGEFLDTVQPERLIMSPTGGSRERLYRAVLKRMMPQISHAYEMEERWYNTLFGEFQLNRKSNWLYTGWTE
jgi:hypothetical protein